MEDSGSILWIVIVLGAILFSGSSKARKQAKEAARKAIKQLEEEGHKHEAWPSWDTPEKPGPRSEPVFGSPATSTIPAESRIPMTSRSPAMPQTPMTSETMPEAVSLETFEPEYVEDEIGALQFEREGSLGAKVVEIGRTPASTSPSAQTGSRTPDKTISETEIGIGNSTAGIREKFDLRKAVIYSEILKPKFDE